MTTERFLLSDTERAQFDELGYLGPYQLYEPAEMKEVYRKVRAQLMDRKFAPYDSPVESAIANYDRHLDVSLLSAHICRPEITQRLRGILGDDVLCWRSEFIPKPPGAEGTDWHQADTFEHASGAPQLVWNESDKRSLGGCINVWTAFTRAAEDNGCLMFIPGTQREMHYDESKGLVYDPVKNTNLMKGSVPRGFNGYDYRELQKDPSWRPDEAKAINMVMKPGEFVIFRSVLLHASKPNRTSDETRLGYVARYVPGDVRVYPDTVHLDEFGGQISLERYGAVVVSGRNLAPSNRVRTTNLRGEPFPSWA